MATPATMKKIEEKKAIAAKRKEKATEDGGTQLLSLSSQANAPSSHLLVRTEPVEGAPPRHIDMRPLASANNMKYRERKEDFSSDVNYTNFADDTGANPQIIAPRQTYYYDPYPPPPNVLQPLSHPSNYYGQFNPRRLPAAKVKQSQLAVVPIPTDVATWELTVLPDKLVCFHGKTNFLSQLYPVSFHVDNNEYLSVEHYYQACKLFSLVGPEAAQVLRSIKDPLKAKVRTRELLFRAGVSNDKVEEWKSSQGMMILLHAMRNKFNEQHEEMHNQLMATGDALLVQDYDKDMFFAAGVLEAGVREWAQKNEGTVLKFPVDMSPESVKFLPLVGKGKNVLGTLAMNVRNNIRAKPKEDNDGEEKKGQYDIKTEVQEQREQQMSPGLANAMSCLNMANDEDDGAADSESSNSDKSKENSTNTVG